MLQKSYSTLEGKESSLPASPSFFLSYTKLLEYAYRRHPGENRQVPFLLGWSIRMRRVVSAFTKQVMEHLATGRNS